MITVKAQSQSWLLLLSLTVLPAANAAAARWLIDVVDGPHLEPGGIAMRSDGDSVVAWGGSLVEVATREAGAWTIETITPEQGSYWWVSLALDSSDRPMVAYHDHRAGTLHFARFDGSAWSRETVDAAGIVGRWCSLALDATDRPVIAYRDDTNRALKLARHDGMAWSFETVADTGDTGTWASLALDAAGNPLIAHRDEAAGSLELATFDGTAWSHQTVDPGFNDSGRHARLALVGGQPVISFQRQQDDQLVVARWQGFWVNEPLAFTLARHSAMGVGADGQIHVAALASKYWKHDGTAWSNSDASQVLGSRLAGLAVDAAGRPWVLGFDAHSGAAGRNAFDSGAVVVNWRDDAGAWTSEIVRDGDDRQRLFGSLSVDSQGRPAIAYTDSSNSQAGIDRQQYLAEKIDATWQIEEVMPATTSRPWYTLAHDEQDRPALAYAESSPTRGQFITRRDAGGWTRQQAETGFACCSIGLTFAPDGTPFFGYSTGVGLRVTHDLAPGLRMETVRFERGDYEQVSMATLDDGRVAIVHEGPSNSWAYSERLADDSWVTEVIDPGLGSCRDPSLAVAPGGRRWTSSSTSLGTNSWSIRAAWSDGTGWTIEEIEQTGSQAGGFTSISVGPDGRPAVAYTLNGGVVVVRRELAGTWTKSELHEASFSHPHSLRHDATGGLHLAHDGGLAVRVAHWPVPLLLHRGVVPDLTNGWQETALPLTADNDDETPPFPVEATLGATTLDASPPAAPLVLYRLLGPSGGVLPAAPLRVAKQPGGVGIKLSH